MPPSPDHTPDPAEAQLARLLKAVERGRSSAEPHARSAARDAWHELVALEYDRVRALVLLFRFPDRPDVAIAQSELDDAVQEAFWRLLGMVDNFRGSSVGEFRAAVRTATNYACMDFCRRALTRQRQLAGSFEEPARSGGTRGRFDDVVEQRSSQAHDEREQFADQLDDVVSAIGQLHDERQREVIRLTAAGCKTEEIAAALGITATNVHQLRSRALKQLRGRIG